MTRTLVPTAGFVHILIEDRGRYVSPISTS